MAVQDIYDAVLEFDEDRVAELVRAELDAGSDVHSVLNQGLIAAMDEVGQKFSEGELFVPEMLMAAQAMKAGLEVLRPRLGADDAQPKGTLVIGTVKGDLHDIGKNLVAMMLEGAGFQVIDLGVDVDTDRFLAAAAEHQAQIVCMSALLTTTMPAMEATVKAIRDNGLAIRTMVGGAPVTEAFARKIGADGYSEDAPGAVELARRLIAA
ncbi:corrinoid protein [Deferrisoma camini]|uniref:corrinoid protein n=1 Tax=Deferrisoma camini TaxID=1035120 RepID=UPI00046CFCD7|nr:corrinoid protein [Deferrisoma camini]